MDPIKRDRGLAGPSTQDASVSGQVLAYGVGLVVFVLLRAVERRLGTLHRIAPRARRGLAGSYGRMARVSSDPSRCVIVGANQRRATWKRCSWSSTRPSVEAVMSPRTVRTNEFTGSPSWCWRTNTLRG